MQETEIEFKNLLTKKEFDTIHDELFKDIEGVEQINYYVDTDKFDLRNHHLMLRVREKNNTHTLTLKVPIEAHTVEEFHRPLEAPLSINDVVSKDMLSRPMFLIIRSNLINRTLKVLGKLTTFRKEIDYNGGTLVLDYSTYLNQEDYEIEFEVDDASTGEEIFKEFLNTYNINRSETIVKSERFYRALESERGE